MKNTLCIFGAIATALGVAWPAFAADAPAAKEDSGLSSQQGSGKIFPPHSKFLQVAGHDAYLALPEGVEAGQKIPWLWYCPSDFKLPGKLEQWMMKQCLDHGIAVAGIDLKGDFGTPAGRVIQTAFYEELTAKHGLTRKVCMLARSYGATQMYNWAAEHPESIAYKALGGDMTVTIFEGQGHNYWTGFFEDRKMAEFIIKHAKATARPKVLFFGDSISGGYGNSLIKLMEGKAEMVKLGAVATYRINEEAFWHSSGKAKALDFGSAKACIADLDRFAEHLADHKYDVIHFNFGLNDIFRGRGGAWHNPVDQYAKDLEKIVALLKKNGAKVIWANITPIPENCPTRPVGDELIYNAAAEKVMKKHGIPINDLHGVVTAWDGYAEWKKGNDVHFPGAVYAKLAEQIAGKILGELEANETKPASSQ